MEILLEYAELIGAICSIIIASVITGRIKRAASIKKEVSTLVTISERRKETINRLEDTIKELEEEISSLKDYGKFKIGVDYYTYNGNSTYTKTKFIAAFALEDIVLYFTDEDDVYNFVRRAEHRLAEHRLRSQYNESKSRTLNVVKKGVRYNDYNDLYPTKQEAFNAWQDAKLEEVNSIIKEMDNNTY